MRKHLCLLCGLLWMALSFFSETLHGTEHDEHEKNLPTFTGVKTSDDRIIAELFPFFNGRFQVEYSFILHSKINFQAFMSYEDNRLSWDYDIKKSSDDLYPIIKSIGLGFATPWEVAKLSDGKIFLIPNFYLGSVKQSLPETDQKERKGLRTRLGLDLGWERAYDTKFVLSVKGGLEHSFDSIKPFVKKSVEYNLGIGVGYSI